MKRGSLWKKYLNRGKYKMTKTQQRVQKVLGRMTQLIEQDEDYADFFTEGLEEMLESLSNNDAFGTEAQADPRGDGRDGVVNMWNVQGIDKWSKR